MSENYQLVYQSHRKVEIYRDTGVSKKTLKMGDLTQKVHLKIL